jgi:hypothetical protein
MVGMAEYFRIDLSKLSLSECWRFSKGVWTLGALLGAKLLGRRWLSGAAHARVESIIRLGETDVAEHVRAAMEPHLAALRQSGMRFWSYYKLDPPPLPSTNEACGAVLRSDDGQIIATVAFVSASARGRTREAVVSFCQTRFSDGVRLVTGNCQKQFDPKPNDVPAYCPGKSAAEVLTIHRERINERPAARPLKIEEGDLERLLIEDNNAVIDYFVRRGLYVPVTRPPDAPRPNEAK